jgi:hypothetical protein
VRERTSAFGAGMVVRRFSPEVLYGEVARVAGVSYESQMENRKKVMDALDAN